MDMIEVGPIRIPDFPMKVWPFLPSWPDSAAEPEVETSYLTEVIKSRSGKEQRSASRQWPRYRMRYERILWGEEYREAKAMLQTGKHQPWYFMRVGRDFRLTDAISIGDQNAVVLDDAPAWCSEGRVLIFTDGTRFEAQIIVADRGSNSFDFNGAFTEAWGVGTRVYAGLVGYFADNTALRKETSQVARLTVEVEGVAGANVPDEVVVAGEPLPRYNPGLLLRPNWAEQVDATMQSPADRVDFDHGVVDRRYPEFTRETWQYTYLSRNREDSLLVNQKFTELMGRLTETYLPTWDADFLPRGGTAASASVIRIQGQYFYTSNTHNALFIESGTGEQWSVGVASYKEVNDALGADTLVTLDTPLPQAVTGEQIKRISWLMRARLANDTLTETFLTDSVSNIVLNIQTLDKPPVGPVFSGPVQVLTDTPSLSNFGLGCAFSPGGDYLAVGHNGAPNLSVFSVSDWSSVEGVAGVAGAGRGCAFSPEGDLLAVAHTESPYLTVLRTSDWSVVPGTPVLPGFAYNCAFSPNGEYLAVAHFSSPRLTVLRTSDWSVVPGTPTPSNTAYDCAFSPNGEYLAVAHATLPALLIVRTSDWSAVTNTPTLPGWGYSCAFSPGGGYLAVGHAEAQHLTVLTTADWEAVAGLPSLPNTGRGCAFSADGNYLAVGHPGSPYLTVLLTEDWSERPSTPPLPGTGYGVAFSFDGRYFASAHSQAPYLTVIAPAG